MAIVFGWILVALQVISLMGSGLDAGFSQLGLMGIIGYFLPGILGVVLLSKGYSKRNSQ